MNTLLKLEEAGKLLLSYILSILLGYEWWIFLVWFLAPDLSMVGYLINTKVGAILYNFFHHQGVAIIIGLIGLYLKNTDLQFAGAILFGHSAFDRMVGYGLKYSDSFKNTHLGVIGKKQ
jgi:hypothetical protein